MKVNGWKCDVCGAFSEAEMSAKYGNTGAHICSGCSARREEIHPFITWLEEDIIRDGRPLDEYFDRFSSRHTLYDEYEAINE